jgi:hypothetical protein
MLNRVDNTDSDYAWMVEILLDDFSQCSLSYLFKLNFHFPRNLFIQPVLFSSLLMEPKHYSLIL